MKFAAPATSTGNIVAFSTPLPMNHHLQEKKKTTKAYVNLQREKLSRYLSMRTQGKENETATVSEQTA